MKNILIVFILSTLFQFVFGQATTDYTVQTWAEVEDSPSTITINWLAVIGAEQYVIYRKEKVETSWGSALATLDNTVTSYEDSNIEIGVSYEYKIEKTGNVTGYGYINSGIDLAPVHHRGNILLLVDSSFISSLSVEITQLIEDLTGDGWSVFREDVNREGTVAEIKQIVLDRFEETTNNLQAIFCLGHVPVPYSGNYAPDGHTNNHEGAWPSDTYYGEIDGNWTDFSANNITASQERTHNVPDDGKFDQTFLPSNLEMQVGRVDFANMPAFGLTEEELLRQYLDKDHEYKHGNIQTQMKAVIDDNFGGFNGEAFAGAAWKSFAPLLNPENVSAADYRTSMDTASYIWSYGCGGGSYTSCSGVGNTANLAGDSLQGIFSSLFGSYFGDWDSQNNFLRASLAQGTMLTNCWSGRPHWYFHHMGMGENIGYSAKASMNNNGVIYNTPLQFLARLTSMGLMGDPSLRMHIMAPPSDLMATFNDFDINLTWTASQDPAAGYFIYRFSEEDSQYVLLNSEVISTTTYSDSCIEVSGEYKYMVRASKLQETPSGSFHNLSQGIFASEQAIVQLPSANFTSVISMASLEFDNLSIMSDSWEWNFGDNVTSTEFEPTHEYAQSGDYLITLTASNMCFQDSFSNTVSVNITSLNELADDLEILIYPNPVIDILYIHSTIDLQEAEVLIYNAEGVLIHQTRLNDGNINLDAISSTIYPGLYFAKINSKKGTTILQFIKI